MTPQEIINVVTAFKNGATIEAQQKLYPHVPWSVCATPNWDFKYWNYRVKKQSKKIKLLAYLTHCGSLVYYKELSENNQFIHWKRIPSEDKLIEVEE